jgi:hypothetical protein
MGKVFKILKEVLLIGSFAVLFVALIIGGVTLDASDLLVSEGFRQFGLLLAGFVGLFLMHSSHDVAYKVGTGLAIGTMILAMNFGLMFIDVGLAGIMCLIAVILFVLYWVILFVGKIAVKDNPSLEESEMLVEKINRWHELLEKEVITKEEFLAQRDRILGIKSQAKK